MKNRTSWTKRQGKTSRLGTLIMETITPICQQNGFIQARILLEWTYIVTPQFSHFCIPLKVTFPFGHRTNGRLYLRVSSSMAMEFSYMEPMILSRINQYFGYQAISKINFFQAPVNIKPAGLKDASKPPLSTEVQTALEQQVCSIKEEPLRSALLMLGAGLHENR